MPEYAPAAVAPGPLDNRDLLAWFRDDERSDCAWCGERTAVTFPKAEAVFCLACGAIAVAGARLDVQHVNPMLFANHPL